MASGLGIAVAILVAVAMTSEVVAPSPPAAYEIADLGVLPGGTYSNAWDINNAGQIVGYGDKANNTNTQAILWQDGTMTELGTRGSSYSAAIGINERGQIVGWTGERFTPYTRAFLWENGTMTDILATNDRAYAVNDKEQVAGSSNPSPSVEALFWDNGTRTTIGGGFAEDINDRGQVVGYLRRPNGTFYAFVWENGTLTDLMDGGCCGRALGINDAGQIVGSTGGRAVLWEGGMVTDLGTLGGDESEASSINDAGQIVGASLDAAGERHAFLWEGGTMTDLGTLPGGSISRAEAINDWGQIVGSGDDASGAIHAVLWTPPPAVHDVAVTSASADPVVAVAGTTVTITVSVENQGNRPETFEVEVFAGSSSVGTQTVEGLGAGESAVLSFGWDTSGFDAGLYEVRAQAAEVSGETDLEDNDCGDGIVVLLPGLPDL